MAVVYIRELDFHIASEEEHEEIMEFFRRKMLKSWVKRFLVFFVIALICFSFQSIVRINMPWMFSKDQTIYRLFLFIAMVFVIINILSWLELILERDVIYNSEKDKILKLKVKTKIHSENLTVMRQQKWFITCETDEGMIEDAIIVRSKSDYKNIRVGDMVYVERTNDDGHYLYYYLA